METKVKRREWVKTAAIVLLSVLLVLTFFSNTIMNHSLPEVAAQYVESGSINARIRGNGTVSANEVYEVSLSQTRKVQSVLVKVGQEVTAGDPLFMLESMDSEELKAAQEQLAQMELDYQKSLISMSNDSSTEDRGIQKLREEYEEALRLYRVYSNVNPDNIELELKEAEEELRWMQDNQRYNANELSDYQSELAEAKAAAVEIEGKIESLQTEIGNAEKAVDQLSASIDILNRDAYIYEADYDRLEYFAEELDPSSGNSVEVKMAAFAEDYALLMEMSGITENEAKALSKAYDVLQTDLSAVMVLLQKEPDFQGETSFSVQHDTLVEAAENQIEDVTDHIDILESELEYLQNANSDLSALERTVKELEETDRYYNQLITDQQTIIADLTAASGAAERLKAAEEALEDAVFESNLGNTQNLDMEKARKDIEEQKALVEELSQEADGKEITAKVSGVITAIHVTAGNTAGAEQPIAEITIADRGYTVQVSVTAEQARQVRIGDTAQVTNYYWGDISATLENIANDPQSMGQNKILIFRINGEGVEAGTNLSLSIGQKSANYDCLVPNSAIRSDSNGSFVLVVTSKSSPLGNRYQATRVPVEVLAADDTTSAVSGLSNGDFVITTSTKPLEAGDMVRLPDQG